MKEQELYVQILFSVYGVYGEKRFGRAFFLIEIRRLLAMD